MSRFLGFTREERGKEEKAFWVEGRGGVKACDRVTTGQLWGWMCTKRLKEQSRNYGSVYDESCPQKVTDADSGV